MVLGCRTLITILLMSILALPALGDNPDAVIGVWLTADEDGHIEIYKNEGLYYGKIIWGENLYEDDGETLTTDNQNPDEELRDRPLKNMDIIMGFEYNDGEWTGGKIYDPNNGRTYSARMRMKNGELHLRGYVGFSAFGRTEVWQRLEE